MSMQHDSHARFYQFRQADIFDKPDQNIRDGHGPQIQRGHATAVGPAPAPVREESVADSVDGDEEEMTEQVQHYLTHDGHGCHGQGGRQAGPVPEEREVADRVQEYEDVKAIDEEENDDASLVQHDLTHDGHGCHGQGGRHAGPVPEERDVARLGPE